MWFRRRPRRGASATVRAPRRRPPPTTLHPLLKCRPRVILVSAERCRRPRGGRFLGVAFYTCARLCRAGATTPSPTLSAVLVIRWAADAAVSCASALPRPVIRITFLLLVSVHYNTYYLLQHLSFPNKLFILLKNVSCFNFFSKNKFF